MLKLVIGGELTGNESLIWVIEGVMLAENGHG